MNAVGRTRTNEGAYVPPFKLARLLSEASKDKNSEEYQRLSWEALRKSIYGLINKVNASNVKHILPELFSENLIRGKGLLCQALMKSQVASPSFTPVYTALVSVINTKFPDIGELLLHRIVTAFKRSWKRNDKQICMGCLTFIAHLVNQQVAHEVLAFEIILLLLEHPTDDAVEMASEFIKECGAKLQDLSPSGVNFVFDRLRLILHEGKTISKRVQYIIEGLYSIRKTGFEESGYFAVPENLDLVEDTDQITHEVTLDDELEPHMALDHFKMDPEFLVHEEEYKHIRHEILGESSSEEDEESEEEENDSSHDEDDDRSKNLEQQGPIHDETGTDLVNLRRTIYLTIMSALDFEEAGHKLLKMGIPPGQENELATMIIECCSQEKTFIKYYALLAERFCKVKREYADSFADCFVAQYGMVHRLETNKLRNVAKLFAHLLATDALPWAILGIIRLTEEDTTSSSRIFIKILFQELAEIMGLKELNTRLQDPTCTEWFEGLFPKDSAKNMRFAINFFTSIGLGGLTDTMREFLKDLPRILEQARKNADGSSRSSYSTGSDTGSSTYTTSSGTYTTSSHSRSHQSYDTEDSASSYEEGERKKSSPPRKKKRKSS